MNPHYPEVARRAGHRCEYGRAPEGAFDFPFEVEHVVPTSRGGTDEPSNLALSCRACNVRKGDAVSAVDGPAGGEAALFDPRTDRRGDQLRFDADSGELIGLTPVGRATIARLDLNHPFQLAARHVWVQLRLYP